MCYSEHMEVRGVSPHLLFLRQGPLWRFCLLHTPASPHTSWHPPASAFYLCGTGGIKVTHCCVCLYTLEIRTQVLVLAQQALSLVTHLPTPTLPAPLVLGPSQWMLLPAFRAPQLTSLEIPSEMHTGCVSMVILNSIKLTEKMNQHTGHVLCPSVKPPVVSSPGPSPGEEPVPQKGMSTP